MNFLWELAPFLLIIVVLLLICRVGASLLVLTGLDRPTAQFQALSALTGTGFTTRASEVIVGHEMRRRIVMTLMVLGNAGLVGGVAALLLAFRSYGANITFFRLAILAFFIWFLFWISGRRKLWGKVGDRLQNYLQSRPMFQRSSVEELLSIHGDYSIVEIEVNPHDRNVNKSLRNTDFRRRKILVLGLYRNEKLNPLPGPEEVIKAGDRLVCYGNLDSITDTIIRF